jgi:hypothetical protein
LLKHLLRDDLLLFRLRERNRGGRLTIHCQWYCQLNATLGLFSLESGEEEAFLESFFAKNHQKTTQKSSQWGKLIKGNL